MKDDCEISSRPALMKKGLGEGNAKPNAATQIRELILAHLAYDGNGRNVPYSSITLSTGKTVRIIRAYKASMSTEEPCDTTVNACLKQMNLSINKLVALGEGFEVLGISGKGGLAEEKVTLYVSKNPSWLIECDNTSAVIARTMESIGIFNIDKVD